MQEGNKTKKHSKRWVAAGALSALMVLALSVGLAGCGEAASTGGSAATPTDSKTLRVGVRDNVVRFGYLNESTGRYAGLEIDIAEEMAARLGYSNVEWVTATPTNKEELLENDDVDCVVACYSINEARAEKMNFSPAYYTDASVVMVEDSSLFTTINDLKGCTFGTVTDTNTASQLADKLTAIGFSDGELLSSNEDGTELQYDEFRVLELPSYQELSTALEEGTIDAMCADGSLLFTYLTDDRHKLDFQIATQDYGVATPKDSALSEPISETIQAMLDDGTITALIDKWD